MDYYIIPHACPHTTMLPIAAVSIVVVDLKQLVIDGNVAHTYLQKRFRIKRLKKMMQNE